MVSLYSTYYTHRLSQRPPYFPTVVPSDIAPVLFKYHGDPAVWWTGQFVRYLLRLQSFVENMMDLNITSLGHRRPIVGVQVRRTDKIGSEAALYELDKYMVAVDDYYNELEIYGDVKQRCIYLSTDEPAVIDEALAKYGDRYEVLSNRDVAALANVETRYLDSSLFGLILDIRLLSSSDFIVCTLTSQVCRMAYEVMQTLHADASDRVFSLDALWHFNDDAENRMRVVLPHRATAGWEFTTQAGEIVETFAYSNFTMGWALVRTMKENENGTERHNYYIPRFKTDRVFRSMDFPVQFQDGFDTLEH